MGWRHHRLVLVLAICIGFAFLAASEVPTPNAEAQTAPEATIAALQTRVAELKTSVAKRDARIDQLQTRVADLLPTPATTPTAVAPASATLNGVQIAVTSWEFRATVGASPIEVTSLRGVFLLVTFDMTNTGGVPQDVPFAGLLVLDENGHTFLQDPQAQASLTITESLTPVTEIQLGARSTQSVVLVFDVPTDSTSFAVTTADRAFVLPITGP